jgi:ketosteroid isomerase-like protein
VAQDFRDLGDEQVLVLGRVEGRGAGSGGLVDAEIGQIFDFRDGKISRSRTYLDKDEARRAAGLA